MNAGKANMPLAKAQVLTNAYVLTSNVGAFQISEESLATLEVLYTTGAAETASNLIYLVEFSNDNSNWVQQNSESLAAGSLTLTPYTTTIAGGAGATAYTGQQFLPLCSRWVRVRVKETGVITNYGTVSINCTMAAGNGQIRNLQQISVTSGGGTQDVNLIKVGGVAVALGQTTMSASLPVTLASNQSALTVTANAGTNLNTSALALESGGNLATIAGAVTSSKMATKVADGDNVVEGATADAVVVAGASGTISAKLRRISQDISDFKAANHTDLTAATPAGTNVIGKVTIDQTTPGTTNLVYAAGDTASGASDAGNPLKIGGIAKTANPAAVTDGQRVNALFDKVGKQIMTPVAARQLMGSQTTTITASTSETTIVTAVASTFLDLTTLIISNTSATATRCDIRDTTAGSVIFSIYIPAGDIRGISFAVPIPQTTVNTNWTCQSSASVTDLRVWALYAKNI